MKRLMIAALAAILALPAMAQEDSLKDLPGYIDFGELSSVYGEPKVQINLGGSILNFVGAMSAGGDPETAELLNNLKGVRVHIYSTKGDASAALDKVSSVKSMLKSSNWESIVQVNDDDEQVHIFVQMDGDKMNGLTLMAVDDEEAVFVNIIGKLDPAQLSEVMDNFDIDIEDHMEIDID